MMNLLSILLLLSSTAFAKVCGQDGTIEERIKDCGVTKENFALVSSDDKSLEVYQDQKTKLIWGNRVMTDFNHYGSQKACDEIPEKVVLKHLKWRLPTVKEFEQSAAHGMKAALPNMTYWFWTSTPVRTHRSRKWRRRQPSQVFIWDGVEQKSDTGDIKDAASVRCVSNG